MRSQSIRPISCASTHVFGNAMQAEHIYPHIRHRDEEEGVFRSMGVGPGGPGGLSTLFECQQCHSTGT